MHSSFSDQSSDCSINLFMIMLYCMSELAFVNLYIMLCVVFGMKYMFTIVLWYFALELLALYVDVIVVMMNVGEPPDIHGSWYIMTVQCCWLSKELGLSNRWT
jgi:hypothetical protein